MTFSLLVFDPVRAEIGAAIASCYPAVGAVCLHQDYRGGMAITQSMANPWLGATVVEDLSRGISPEAALLAALGQDPNRFIRQTHCMDFEGRSFAESGSACISWAGLQRSAIASAAGNMLTGPEVLVEMIRSVENSSEQPMVRRLVDALRAAERVGGDKRGRQAAAIRVCRNWTSHPIDLRVDDHPDPIAELDRIYLKLETAGTFQAFDETIPDESDPRAPQHPAIVL
jgi:uncharacterized Ntn-hydrolase superfamily protein